MKYFVLILLILMSLFIEKDISVESFLNLFRCGKDIKDRKDKIPNIKHERQCVDDCYESFITKPFIWVFLDNEISSRNWKDFGSRRSIQNTPDYIKLCLKTLEKNNRENFNIQILNETNLKVFIRRCFFKWNDNKIDYKLKKQFIKYYILYNYGGIWLEPDNIVFKSLTPIVEKLSNYDMITFGCSISEIKCNQESDKSFENIACNKGSKILKCILYEILNKINTVHNDYSFYNINKSLMEIYQNYKDNIYVFDAEFNGSRDINGKIINIENMISNNYTLFKDYTNVLFISCDSYNIKNKTKFKWVEKLSSDEILNSNMWISKLIRYALGLKEIYVHAKNNILLNKNNEIYNIDNNYNKNINKMMMDPYQLVNRESYRDT